MRKNIKVRSITTVTSKLKLMKHQVNTFLLIIRLHSILLFPLLSSNFLPNTLAQTNSIENIKEYESSVFGLSIDYPSTWLIDEFEKNIKNDGR